MPAMGRIHLGGESSNRSPHPLARVPSAFQAAPGTSRVGSPCARDYAPELRFMPRVGTPAIPAALLFQRGHERIGAGASESNRAATACKTAAVTPRSGADGASRTLERCAYETRAVPNVVGIGSETRARSGRFSAYEADEPLLLHSRSAPVENRTREPRFGGAAPHPTARAFGSPGGS